MRPVGQAMEVVGRFVNRKELFLLIVVYMINRTEGRKKENQGWITQVEVGQYMQRKKWCTYSKETIVNRPKVKSLWSPSPEK